MRCPAPTPQSAWAEIVEEGYQLCGRCGGVLAAGDSAVIVRRSPSWLIYTHPHQCSRNAVHGWLAVRRVEGIRDSANIFTPMPALECCQPISEWLGSPCRCVCFLDEKHIRVERDLVTLTDEWPAKPCDIRSVLERRMRRDYADGYRCTIPSEDAYYEDSDRAGVRHRSPIVRNYVEDNLVAALDRPGGLERLDWGSQEIQKLRSKTYMTGRALSDLVVPGNPILLALLGTRPALLPLNLALLDALLAPLDPERCEITSFVPITYSEEGRSPSSPA